MDTWFEPQCNFIVPELAAQQYPTTPGFEPVQSLRNCICAGFTKTTIKSILIVTLWWFCTHCRKSCLGTYCSNQTWQVLHRFCFLGFFMTVYFFLIHPVYSWYLSSFVPQAIKYHNANYKRGDVRSCMELLFLLFRVCALVIVIYSTLGLIKFSLIWLAGYHQKLPI